MRKPNVTSLNNGINIGKNKQFEETRLENNVLFIVDILFKY